MRGFKYGFFDELATLTEDGVSRDALLTKYAKKRTARRSIEIIRRLPVKKSTKQYLVKKAVFNRLKRTLGARLLASKMNRRLDKPDSSGSRATPGVTGSRVTPIVERVRRVFGKGPLGSLTSSPHGNDYLTQQTRDRLDGRPTPAWLRPALTSAYNYSASVSDTDPTKYHVWHGSPHLYPIEGFARNTGIGDFVRNASYFGPKRGMADHYGSLRQQNLLNIAVANNSYGNRLDGITISRRPGEYGVYQYDLTGKKLFDPSTKTPKGFQDKIDRSFSDWLIDKYNIASNEKNQQLLGPASVENGGWVRADQSIPMIGERERAHLQIGHPSGFLPFGWHGDSKGWYTDPEYHPGETDRTRTGPREPLETDHWRTYSERKDKYKDHPISKKLKELESQRKIESGPLKGDWRHEIPSRLNFDGVPYDRPLFHISSPYPHEQSPEMHTRFFRDLGVDGYVREDTGTGSSYPEYAIWDASTIKPVPGQKVPEFKGPFLSGPGKQIDQSRRPSQDSYNPPDPWYLK